MHNIEKGVCDTPLRMTGVSGLWRGGDNGIATATTNQILFATKKIIYYSY